MIKKVQVARREIAINLRRELRHSKDVQKLAIISVCSTEADIIFTDDVKNCINCQDVISLVVADITANDLKISPELLKHYKYFDITMAEKIIKFINRIKEKDVDLLFIHCDAGQSRSAAIGIWVVRYLKLDENEFRKEHRMISPNTLIYDLLAKTSNLHGDYTKWWEDVDFDPRIRFI